MDHFLYRDGTLHAEDVPLTQIAAEVGTPFYVYSTATLLRRGASVGANATLLCGITVGRYAMIAAGTVVTRDVPDHALVVGNPGRVREYVCRCARSVRFEGESAECSCGLRLSRRDGEVSVTGK